MLYNIFMDKKTIATPGFTQDIIDELKKVSWPSKKTTTRLTLVVVLISLIIGIYVGIIDVLLAKGLDIVMKFR
jgi:preprotein translocase subunit SecE